MRSFSTRMASTRRSARDEFILKDGKAVVLGVSCDYHDAAAALCVDGEVVAAVQQERLSRTKHDAELPVDAIGSCLAIAGLSPDDLTSVVYYEKPLNVLGRFFATRQAPLNDGGGRRPELRCQRCH